MLGRMRIDKERHDVTDQTKQVERNMNNTYSRSPGICRQGRACILSGPIGPGSILDCMTCDVLQRPHCLHRDLHQHLRGVEETEREREEERGGGRRGEEGEGGEKIVSMRVKTTH